MKIGKYRVYFKGRDWFIPLFILAYTIVYYTETIRLPHPEVHNLLIRPVVYAIIIASGVYFFTRLGWEPAGEESPRPSGEGQAPGGQALREKRKFLIFLLETVIYLPLISLLGFTLASAAYMVAAMLLLGVRNVKILILLPLVTVIGLLLMFETWLMIPVPKGILGF